MTKIFQGLKVILSGGLGDIGRATILEFAKGGADIAFCDIKPVSEAVEFLDTIKDFEVNVKYDQVDVSDFSEVASWVEGVERKLGVCQIVIVNAAIATNSNLLEISSNQWSREIGVNLDGAFNLAQCASKRLIENKLSGRIVFIGSWAAHAVHTRLPAYCVSKAGIRMLCKCLALELAPYQILVNEIALGFVNAGLSGKQFKNNPTLREDAEKRVPIKALISSEEVAQEIINLSSPRMKHITGATILMDGGLSLLSGAI